MRSKFRLELDVVMDTDAAAEIIANARENFAKQPAVTAGADSAQDRTVTAEDFVAEIEDALIELVAHNPLLTAVNVELERISCRELEGVRDR